MRGVRSAAASAAFLVAILAGCVGSGASGAETSPPDSSIDGGAGAIEDAGWIDGSVVDDQLAPIAGAMVGLELPALQVSTDEAGRFSISNLAPGSYKLYAQALGYESVAKVVEVLPEAGTEVTIQLTPIKVTVAYVEVLGPFEGYFECRLGIGTQTGECGWVGPLNPYTGHPTFLYPNDKTIFRFNMTSDDYRTFVGEMRWQPTSLATSPNMRLAFSYEERPSTHWWCAGEGPTPLQWRFSKDGEDDQCVNRGGTTDPKEPKVGMILRAYANVPFPSGTNQANLALQQKFQVMVSIFYGDPAPAEYSGFPD